MNLQKFTLSTLTFSLATALAVLGFSESASAAKKGKKYNKSANLPALVFEGLFETDDGKIVDTNDNPNIGVFLKAIELENVIIQQSELKAGELFGGFGNIGFVSDNKKIDPTFNLSAKKQNGGSIEYQIYQGEDVNNPDIGIRFASVEPSALNGDFVNNIEDILNDSIPKGKDGFLDSGYLAFRDFADNKGENFPDAGILGRALIDTLRFIDDTNRGDDFVAGENLDNLTIERIGAAPITTIPEPTTTLASLFVLGVSGISLRKRRKNNLI